jgi:hypothetical protein
MNLRGLVERHEVENEGEMAVWLKKVKGGICVEKTVTPAPALSGNLVFTDNDTSWG